ncbi:MAG: HepT-like ribonuclease domain-containing protein [Microthrixaceae bacterium]
MRRELLLIGEMIDAAEQAQLLVRGINVEALEQDRQRRDALLWNFSVMGEAASQLSEEVKVGFPEIPWTQPSKLRNRVIHGYWSIDIEILHTTAKAQLPAFVDQLRQVLAHLENEG